MKIADLLLLDFDTEAESTRRILERIPSDRATWKPHDRSMSLGSIAAHIAGLPIFGLQILTTPEIDLSASTSMRYQFTTAEDAVKHAAGGAAEIRTALSSLSDDELLAPWTLRFGVHVIATLPRAVAYRSMFFNHLIHHRGQLNVYLRQLDIPVPGVYGPSADEPWAPK